MGKLRKIGYNLEDVAVVQAAISYIDHRNEASPFIDICGNASYPIFVSPMASVTDQNNYKIWLENRLGCVVPRSVQKSENNPNGLTFEERMEIAKETFVSISLEESIKEFNNWIDNNLSELVATGTKVYICVDIAHGTMNKLYKSCRKIKERCGNAVEIMTGNVANPQAYKYYADCGIDWMRLCIGSGSRCTTAANVAVYYPAATLLDEINEEKKKYVHEHGMKEAPTKVICDGGIRNFDDIQKALALGADAVMSGNIFARAEEACDEIFWAKNENDAMLGITYSKDDLIGDLTITMRPFRNYFGMSTRQAQRITGGSGTTTAEGISRPVPVEYPIAKWVDNMQSYLRSCMSYANSFTIEDFKKNAQVIILGGSGDKTYRK